MQTELYIKQSNRVKDSTSAVIKALGIESRGQIINLEHTNNTFCQWLDLYAGCDLLFKDHDNNVFGIALRTQLTKPQWEHLPQNTFTIRETVQSGANTEFQKRIKAIAEGYMFPRLTIQAYCAESDPNKVLSACIVRTVDLYEFIHKYPNFVGGNHANNNFKFVHWHHLHEKGYTTAII